jgi:hypothetical protein
VYSLYNNHLVGALSPSAQAIEMQRHQHEMVQAQQMLQRSFQQPKPPLESLSPQPNYSKVFNFLGNLFDPITANQLHTYSDLSNLDKETVQSLMNNMSSPNINSQFRDQHTFLWNQYQDLVRTEVLCVELLLNIYSK